MSIQLHKTSTKLICFFLFTVKFILLSATSGSLFKPSHPMSSVSGPFLIFTPFRLSLPSIPWFLKYSLLVSLARCCSFACLHKFKYKEETAKPWQRYQDKQIKKTDWIWPVRADCIFRAHNEIMCTDETEREKVKQSMLCCSEQMAPLSVPNHPSLLWLDSGSVLSLSFEVG